MEQVLGNPSLKQLNNKAEALQRSGASALIIPIFTWRSPSHSKPHMGFALCQFYIPSLSWAYYVGPDHLRYKWLMT
jgi:hypothetical protein